VDCRWGAVAEDDVATIGPQETADSVLLNLSRVDENQTFYIQTASSNHHTAFRNIYEEESG
jgi:hypothetical protein